MPRETPCALHPGQGGPQGLRRRAREIGRAAHELADAVEAVLVAPRRPPRTPSCGSGKKYKNCCLRRGVVIPTTLSGVVVDPNRKRRRRGGKPAPRGVARARAGSREPPPRFQAGKLSSTSALPAAKKMTSSS